VACTPNNLLFISSGMTFSKPRR